MIVFVPVGDPAKDKTLNIPSVSEPSVVVRVCEVPESVILPTPFRARSMMSKFVLVVSPHVPD